MGNVLLLPSTLDGFGEMDVREEVITPLLHHLGYKVGTSAHIIREQSLLYPRIFLGRKNPSRDPPLRGLADYILEIDNQLRWTIEAKSPAKSISADDVEQAYSYSCHPQVAAIYFALVNGTELRVYQSDHGPQSNPILALAYADITGSIHRIENLLSPAAIRRDHPKVVPDEGYPIGPGLRSLVRIVGGFVEFQRSEPDIPLLAQLTLSIIEGAIERTADQRLVIYLKTRSPFRSINDLNERLGLSRLELVSAHSALSTNHNSPTTFTQQMIVTLPVGAKFPDVLAGGDSVLTRNLTCRSTTTATGILERDKFIGQFLHHYEYLDVPTEGQTLSIDASGRFEASLA